MITGGLHRCGCGKEYTRRQNLYRHKKTCFSAKNCDETSETVSQSLPRVSHQHVCQCGRSYKHASSLSKHRKSCAHSSCEVQEDDDPLPENEKLMMAMLQKVESGYDRLNSTVDDLRGQVLEVAKDPKYVTNNTLNNSLNNFNFFLNEQCADAVSINEFVDKLQVQLSEVEYTLSNGKVAGIANIIQRGFEELGVYKRPVHCTDLKRQTLYIKDDGAWSKDNQEDKMTKLIRGVDCKQCKNIKGWEAANPGCRERGSKLEEAWVLMVRHLTSPLVAKDMRKITRRCAESYHIDKCMVTL